MPSRLSLLVSILVLTPALACAEPGLEDWGGGAVGGPVAVVVHGINPVPGDLDPLTRDVRARGYRTHQFHYDGKAALCTSAAQLAGELTRLAAGAPRLVVVAHSMGGLVSRHALRADGPLADLETPVLLVTIASPFGGFRSANWARLDFGLGPASYDDLGTRARFIRKPGELAQGVTHVKIETDERDQRRVVGERDESDCVARPRHQRQEAVDAAATVHELVAGHMGVVLDPAAQVPEPTAELLTRYLGARRAGGAFAQRVGAELRALRARYERGRAAAAPSGERSGLCTQLERATAN